MGDKMASKEELIASIATAAEEKGIEAPETGGLNHGQLVELLKGVKAMEPVEADSVIVKPPVEAEAEAPEASTDSVIVKPPVKRAAGCYVCEGKALTSKRGILAPGDEAKAEYFTGEEETLNRLIKNGFIEVEK